MPHDLAAFEAFDRKHLTVGQGNRECIARCDTGLILPRFNFGEGNDHAVTLILFIVKHHLIIVKISYDPVFDHDDREDDHPNKVQPKENQ